MDYYADRLGDLAQNEIITPEQWADLRRRTLSVEQQLMLAILVDALHCAILREPMSNRQQRLRWEARLWLEARNQTGPCLTAVDVCAAVGLDADWICARLQAGTIKHVPKHTHVAGLGTQRRKMEARPSARPRQHA